MHAWNDLSRRPALNAEEAALLPAMAPRRMTGGAALKNALDAAGRMQEKQVSNPVSGPIPRKAITDSEISRAERRADRAALKHVTRHMPGSLTQMRPGR